MTVTKRLDDYRIDGGRDVEAELNAVRGKVEATLEMLDELRQRVDNDAYDWERQDWLGVKIAELAVAAAMLQYSVGNVFAAENDARREVIGA
jgi:hypothetical protein